MWQIIQVEEHVVQFIRVPPGRMGYVVAGTACPFFGVTGRKGDRRQDRRSYFGVSIGRIWKMIKNDLDKTEENISDIIDQLSAH